IAEAGVAESAGGIRLRYNLARFAVVPGADVQIGIRPEDLAVVKTSGQSGEAAPHPSQFPVSREFVEELGSSRILHTRANGSPIAILQPASAPLPDGDTLQVSAEPGAIHLFDANGRSLRRPQ